MDRWRSFVKVLLAAAAAVIVGTYLLVALVDPYDALWFSPALPRAPVAENQRYAFPMLARSARFDSLVIGTSTMRHLPPAGLNAALGGRFANLALDNGSPYEQLRLLELFARHHAHPRTVLLGLDIVWCQALERFDSGREFPAWLYDSDRWNDLRGVFGASAITDAIRQVRWLLGADALPRDLDGYAVLHPPERWNLARAQELIYGPQGPRASVPVVPAYVPDEAERARWTFPELQHLGPALQALPGARKVLVFVPYHRFNQPEPGSQSAAQWDACKEEVARLAAGLPDTHVLDFMIASPITQSDANYWDVLHYRVETGTQIIGLIADALRTGRERPGYFRYLLRTEADP